MARAVCQGRGRGDASAALMLALAVALAAVWIPAHGDPVELRQANITAADERFLLDATFRLEPTQAVQDALANGVPLTMKLEIAVFQSRRWWWDRRVAGLEQRYVLRYHALTEQYVVHNERTGRQQTYEGLGQALSALGMITRLPLPGGDGAVRMDRNPYVRLRVQLDVEALPVPLRPLAYLHSSWAFASDWHEVAFPES